MKKYDDASWHYGGEYPQNLPPENAAIHIDMFLTWRSKNDLFSDELQEEFEEDIEEIKSDQKAGVNFLINNCDEKLLSEDLSQLGQNFANDYYEYNTSFAKKSSYDSNFCYVFNKKAEKDGFEYESLYHVEDTCENYNLLAAKVDERFRQWKGFNK